MKTELIRKDDALHAVLHNQGDAAVAAIQGIEAVDAVQVVRCGECKHRDYCDIYAHVKDADFFCKAGWMDLYRGERKDGEHE